MGRLCIRVVLRSLLDALLRRSLNRSTGQYRHMQHASCPIERLITLSINSIGLRLTCYIVLYIYIQIACAVQISSCAVLVGPAMYVFSNIKRSQH